MNIPHFSVLSLQTFKNSPNARVVEFVLTRFFALFVIVEELVVRHRHTAIHVDNHVFLVCEILHSVRNDFGAGPTVDFFAEVFYSVALDTAAAIFENSVSEIGICVSHTLWQASFRHDTLFRHFRKQICGCGRSMCAVTVRDEGHVPRVILKASGVFPCKTARHRVRVLVSHPYIVEKALQRLRVIGVVE